MGFCCGGDSEDYANTQPTRELPKTQSQPSKKAPMMALAGPIDRTQEDKEDAELEPHHKRAIMAVRKLAWDMDETPARDRIEILYQEFRTAVRGAALAIKLTPENIPPHVQYIFRLRQIERCEKAIRKLDWTSSLVQDDASYCSQTEGLEGWAAPILSYGRLLPTLMVIMNNALEKEIGARDEARAEVDRMEAEEIIVESLIGINRAWEDQQDTEVSASQIRGILAVRKFIEGAAKTPAGPRMEIMYQEFRVALRGIALALEVEPAPPYTFPIVYTFKVRQPERCEDAVRKADSVYSLMVEEARHFGEKLGFKEMENAIMKYAKILPIVKEVLEPQIPGLVKQRDEVRADICRMERGEEILGPSK